MRVQQDFLKAGIFADTPKNWLVHADGFYHAGLQLVEAGGIKPGAKLMSTEEIFLNRYTYKIAVYLLSHAIELLLKSIISGYHRVHASDQEASKLLKPTVKYSHNVVEMAHALAGVNVVSFTEEAFELFKLIDEYLAWFGRYYCPQTRKMQQTLQETYTEPDESDMVEFKYQLKCPETHQAISQLYQALRPKNIDAAALTLEHLLHTP